jgi:hypothetical protein
MPSVEKKAKKPIESSLDHEVPRRKELFTIPEVDLEMSVYRLEAPEVQI